MLAPGRGTRGSWVLTVTSRAACGPRHRQEAPSSTPLPPHPVSQPRHPRSPSTSHPIYFFIFSFCLEMNLNGPEEGQLQGRFDCKDLKVLTRPLLATAQLSEPAGSPRCGQEPSPGLPLAVTIALTKGFVGCGTP